LSAFAISQQISVEPKLFADKDLFEKRKTLILLLNISAHRFLFFKSKRVFAPKIFHEVDDSLMEKVISKTKHSTELQI